MTKKLTPAQERRILLELRRRQLRMDAGGVAAVPTEAELDAARRIREMLFKRQTTFFFPDPAKKPSRFRALRCGRRSGKTTGLAGKHLVTHLEDPRAVSLYVAQAAPIIRETVWPEVQEMIAKFDLPFRVHETALRIRHKRSTGRWLLRGCDNRKTIEKFRGLGVGGHFKLASMDESGTWGAALEVAVRSAISPGLRDAAGEFLMTGSPGYFPEGLFYEATLGAVLHSDELGVSTRLKHFQTMHWDIGDNEALEPDRKDLDLIIAEEGLSGYDDPVFIREWKGIYCINTQVQVFDFDPERNTFYGGAPDGLHYYMGLDFGFTDESAIVILAYSERTRDMWVVDDWSDTEQVSADIAVQIREFETKYKIERRIGDTGGSGKGTAEELWRDEGIYVEPATKQQKLRFIEFLNSDLRRGNLKVRKGLKVASELPKVLWNEERTGLHAKGKDNLSMALLYVWRAARDNSGKDNQQPRQLGRVESGIAWPDDEVTAKEALNQPPQPDGNFDWAEWLATER